MDFAEYLSALERARPAEPGPAGRNLIVVEETDSTQRLGRKALQCYLEDYEPPPHALFLAWRQSAGRGRLGRTWVSPGGRGVYATILWPVAEPALLQPLPLLVGVGLCRAVERHLPVPCRLKWPNDLMVEDRKLGGILIETRAGETAAALIGFGVNVDLSEAELPEPRATSLRVAGGAVDLGALAWELVTSVESELEKVGDPAAAVESYRQYSLHRPGDRLVCRVGDETIEGTFAGFDGYGLLLLDTAEGQVRVSAGEVIE